MAGKAKLEGRAALEEKAGLEERAELEERAGLEEKAPLEGKTELEGEADAEGTAQPAVGAGSSIAEVRKLQQLLNAKGANLVVDGNFGSATLAAVKAFQAHSGLVADGIVGPRTMDALSA